MVDPKIDWISNLIQRADIEGTARELAPIQANETVIGRLPPRLKQLWAAYTLQAAGVASIMKALDAHHDYSQPITSADPLNSPTLVHEANKLRLIYHAFWLAVQSEFQEMHNLGIREHWQLVRLPD